MWRLVVNKASQFLRPNEQRVFMSQRQAGVLVTEDTAMTLAEWWACVSVISRTVAALPWRVYERSTSGKKQVEGAVSWLLNNQPNGEMSAFAFREALIAHALNWGNGFAEIQRDASMRPVALWLLTPDRVCIERDAAGALVYQVRGDDGLQTTLRAEDVFHLHGLGFDGVSGYSVVRMAARSIGVGIAQDVFSQAFYANGTVMGVVAEVGATMNADQIKSFEAYLGERHGGPGNAFKPKVAPNGTKISPMGMPLTDAQFIESRGLSITMAARWLGVPPHKIADLSRSTNNNIEHQGIEFVSDAIVPWATRLEQEANVKLFGARALGRVYTKLNVNALMRGDAKSRAEFYRTMTQIGAMSINEVRELEDLNGIGPAGDKHLVQLNQTTLEYLVENPGAKAAAADPKPDMQDAPADPEDDAAPEQKPPTNVIRAQALEWLREQRRQQA